MYIMKRYNIAELRARLAHAFDEVEQGETVVIERRGRRFLLVPERTQGAWPDLPAQVEVSDPSLLENGWGWDWQGPGEPMELLAREATPPPYGAPPRPALRAPTGRRKAARPRGKRA